MLGEHGSGAQFVGRPRGDDQAARRRPADRLGAPAPHHVRHGATEPLEALSVGVDRVLGDPTTAVVAADVDEVVVRAAGMRRSQGIGKRRCANGRAYWA
jgi:hypothetical protein